MLDVEQETGLLQASRPAFGGNIMATILCKKHRPQMATVRPKVMKALPPDPERRGEIIAESLLLREQDIRTKVLKIIRETQSKVRLDEADIIVAGGKGLGSKEGFQLMHRFAEAIGATVGASRDAIEAGWIDHAHQVGQTGVTVTPKIYFAIGISGAIQHLVGMQNSGLIIAINEDPQAPLFQSCHYGIVGDAFEIVPLLARPKCTSGKRCECMWDTRDVTNAEAAGSVARMKTSSGNTRKADTASSSDRGSGRWQMYRVGDIVVYARDGARGIIMEIQGELCQVMWEDTFVSWEKMENLKRAE